MFNLNLGYKNHDNGKYALFLTFINAKLVVKKSNGKLLLYKIIVYLQTKK